MLNRRHFISHVLGASALAIPGMSFLQQLRAAAPTLKKNNKSLIVLWMGGGPATIDIWDLKPGEKTGGEFKPIKTSADGVEISEHMPNVAKQMKHLSIIRSLTTTEGDHNRGRVLMHTSRSPNPIVAYPSIGSVVSHQLTAKDLDLPGFISVGGAAEGPGFLGMNYAPFNIQNPGQPPENIRLPDDLREDGKERIRRRQRLFYAIEDNFIDRLVPGAKNEADRRKRPDAAIAHSDIYGKAFNLVASDRGKVFDLNTESRSLRDAYGENPFGRGCLLARKLVEEGVTCVEVSMGGWDTHNQNFTALKDRQLPNLDKGMGTLVKDLVDRGLWKDTVVVWMGEFGRTPRINANAGRDHWARCWSVVVGGGALKGGIAYGSTDKEGMSVKDNACTVSDLFATLYKGIKDDRVDPSKEAVIKLGIRDNLGRQFEIAEKGTPLKGLL